MFFLSFHGDITVEILRYLIWKVLLFVLFSNCTLLSCPGVQGCRQQLLWWLLLGLRNGSPPGTECIKPHDSAHIFFSKLFYKVSSNHDYVSQRPSVGTMSELFKKLILVGFLNVATSQQKAQLIYSWLMCPFLYFLECYIFLNALLLSKIWEMLYLHPPMG